jgi:hypothetical protein
MSGQDPEQPKPGRGPGDGAAGADPVDDDEVRKPLYRDEVPDADGAAATPAAGGTPTDPPGESGTNPPADQPVDEAADAAPTRVTRGASRVRVGDDATQILPRTSRTGYVGARSDFDRDDDDLDDDFDDRPPLGQRTKLALLVAGVAAVVIVGLAIGYAVLNLGDRPTSAPSPLAPSPTPSASGTPTVDADVLLSDTSMLSAAQAKKIAADRTWKVALTQRGADTSSPQPACLDATSLEGQPPSQQTVLRLISSTGQSAPGILHQADAYATPEEAAQAYALASKAMGGCQMSGAWIQSGGVVTGLGDQAVGEVLQVMAGGKTEWRSVVLNRTGRVVNVVDVAQPGKAVALDGLAGALAAVTNVQCKPAGGRCAAGTAVKDGPPPLGGDQPGFFAAGDLPPVGRPDATWAGTVPGLPETDFSGSGCETVRWDKVAAQKRTARTYLLTDDSPTFGLDDIVLTHKDKDAAGSLVKQVKDDLESCAKRKLTATVSKPAEVKGTAASGADVTGWTATVSQKTAAGTAKYRVGIVAAGTKTAFTFLNPEKSLDLTDAQWDVVAVRAGQRATQVR